MKSVVILMVQVNYACLLKPDQFDLSVS